MSWIGGWIARWVGSWLGPVSQEEEVKTGTGGIDPGENGDGLKKPKHKYQPVKPTGLLYRKKVIIPPVVEPVVKVLPVAKGLAPVKEVVSEVVVSKMSLSEIDLEIRTLLQKQYKTEEDEAMIAIMLAAALCT